MHQNHASPYAFPAPWSLRGEGAMLFYRLPEAFAREHGGIPENLASSFQGIVSCVMLVDYRNSPVGPYRELLFIPGLFGTERGRRFSITRIFVDSQESMEWGRRNWAIPKDMAEFHWKRTGPYADEVRINREEEPMLEASIKGMGPRFPISTALIPLRIHQELDGRVVETSPRGKGMGQWARVPHLRVLSDAFPDISSYRPFAALRVSGFQMTFPEGIVPTGS
ncbi:MAG: acetoacetate decarboxylase family protein [Phaeodactylibacter sp.]|nr:acetoacetate decarboxylase family protein [Phaeodactylibacter sp.]MCB9051424.1 acetoacetate decarboxylase family protein [Lewinellaceae bacterium]